MRVDEAFDIFQGKVDADPVHVRKARRRRDIFGDAFKNLNDVTQVIPSGSLARGTQLDPIHDVDLIAVFDGSAQIGWGEPGSSAIAALSYVEDQVHLLLGHKSPALKKVVGDTAIRNHVVKCFLDPRFLAEDRDFKSFFAVELMPALRNDRGLLVVPERNEEHWQTVDPEWLIESVHRRQEEWPYFVRMIRVVKFWMREVHSGMKSLSAEVLALKCLPEPLAGGMSRSIALSRFFTAATSAVMQAINDPAGYCGEIQPGLNRYQVHDLLKEAAGIAANAVAWEQEGDEHKAICCWKTIFGEDFPMPPGGCPGSGGGGSGGGGLGGGGGGGGRNSSASDDVGGSPGAGGAGARGPSEGGSPLPSDSPYPGPSDDPGSRGGGDRGGRRPAVPVFPPFEPRGPSPSRPVKDAPQG